jgi:hypothetical protein
MHRPARLALLLLALPFAASAREEDGGYPLWVGDRQVTSDDLAEPPSLSNVVARQRWPWNGCVDVDYEVGGSTTGLVSRISFEEQLEGGGGRTWVATNFLGNVGPTLNPGRNRATWDAKADGATNVIAEAVTATVELVREE